MHEGQLAFQIDAGGESQEAAILEVLQHSPSGQWVSMVHLYHVSGAMAVHSRCASLRKKGYAIENKVDRSSKPYKSWYRIAPLPAQKELALQ